MEGTDLCVGTVRQTPSGDIRWTTFSIFHGEERWRSEGIQVGGLKSARGVLGNWFDKYVCSIPVSRNETDQLSQGLRSSRSRRPDGILEGER
jgi:hypothetical protein